MSVTMMYCMSFHSRRTSIWLGGYSQITLPQRPNFGFLQSLLRGPQRLTGLTSGQIDTNVGEHISFFS